MGSGMPAAGKKMQTRMEPPPSTLSRSVSGTVQWLRRPFQAGDSVTLRDLQNDGQLNGEAAVVEGPGTSRGCAWAEAAVDDK